MDFTYGNSAHLDAVTAIGSAYYASYDAVGDMTCRAPDNTTTCAGTATGAQLGYDNEGRLATWQNAPGSPTTTDGFLYDGAGNRVKQSVTVSGTTTWTNPYRYDGRDGVRYDGETGLYWMSVRAYDPALGRFLSRDPLGRSPLFFSDQPYVYGGNNPLVNVDPSGQRIVCDGDCLPRLSPTPPPPPGPVDCHTNNTCPKGGKGGSGTGCHGNQSCTLSTLSTSNDQDPSCNNTCQAKNSANATAADLVLVGAILIGVGFALAGIAWALTNTAIATFILSLGSAALEDAGLEALAVEFNAAAWIIGLTGTLVGIAGLSFAWEATRDDSWWTPSNVGGFAAGMDTTATAVTTALGAVDTWILKILSIPVVGPLVGTGTIGGIAGLIVASAAIAWADVEIAGALAKQLSLIGGESS